MSRSSFRSTPSSVVVVSPGLARRAVSECEQHIDIDIRSDDSIAYVAQIGRHHAREARFQRREFRTPVQHSQPLIAAREHVG